MAGMRNGAGIFALSCMLPGAIMPPPQLDLAKVGKLSFKKADHTRQREVRGAAQGRAAAEIQRRRVVGTGARRTLEEGERAERAGARARPRARTARLCSTRCALHQTASAVPARLRARPAMCAVVGMLMPSALIAKSWRFRCPKKAKASMISPASPPSRGSAGLTAPDCRCGCGGAVCSICASCAGRQARGSRSGGLRPSYRRFPGGSARLPM